MPALLDQLRTTRRWRPSFRTGCSEAHEFGDHPGFLLVETDVVG
jgi:hypothetical protein